MIRPLRRPGYQHRGERGFTLVEVLIATVLLSFALIVMFGFHSQAVRSNLHARKLSDCTYLAQTEMERLLALPWNDGYRHPDLVDSDTDNTSDADPWAWLEHPSSGAEPSAVNAAGNTDTDYGLPIYYVTWDIQDMDDDAIWTRLRVRCVYKDKTFNTWNGTTVSSYRFRD